METVADKVAEELSATLDMAVPRKMTVPIKPEGGYSAMREYG